MGVHCTIYNSLVWFQQKVTEVFIFPLKLQLQYHFSNGNRSLPPFDLNSHTSFGLMCHKLRPLVVSVTLKNGKKLTHKMKVVMVQLFNRDLEGEGHCSSVKNSMVSILLTF